MKGEVYDFEEEEKVCRIYPIWLGLLPNCSHCLLAVDCYYIGLLLVYSSLIIAVKVTMQLRKQKKGKTLDEKPAAVKAEVKR